MARFVGRHVTPEMFGLWLVESVLTFSLAYVLLAPGSFHYGVEVQAVQAALILALAIGLTAFTVGLYRMEVFRRARSLLVSTAIGGLLAFPVAWMVLKAVGLADMWPVGYDAFRPVKIVAIWLGALLTLRFLFHVAVRSNLFVHRVALLGRPAEMAATVAAIRSFRKGYFEVVTAAAATADPAELRAAGVRAAVLPASAPARTLDVRQAYRRAGVRVEEEATFWERCLKRIDLPHLEDAWFVRLDQRPPSRVLDTVNRISDIVISSVFLVVTMPLIVLVAIMVRLDSPGPVLYRQERVGLGGKPFTLLKFRSMRADAEARGPSWAQKSDPRVTRIGATMRRTRIDELPQLLNVLRGEMSFIGPRPERPHFVEQLADVIPFYRERSRVKPGLTGWAQVNYPYGASVDDARAKLSYDLYYVKNRSVMLDVLILFATVRVILFQEGAR